MVSLNLLAKNTQHNAWVASLPGFPPFSFWSHNSKLDSRKDWQWGYRSRM